MRQVVSSRFIEIPDGVEVQVKARKVRVKGPRGVLVRNFKHVQVDMFLTEQEGVKKLRVEKHFGKRKELSVIRTVTSHVSNMITGVTKGYEYKMRLVYAHFPINVNIANEGKRIEIRNFLGEKRARIVNMQDGVEVARPEGSKDELSLTGNDIELVSRSAASIHQSCLVKNKDIRKFLDGIYVSEKGLVVKEE